MAKDGNIFSASISPFRGSVQMLTHFRRFIFVNEFIILNGYILLEFLKTITLEFLILCWSYFLFLFLTFLLECAVSKDGDVKSCASYYVEIRKQRKKRDNNVWIKTLKKWKNSKECKTLHLNMNIPLSSNPCVISWPITIPIPP